MRYDYAMSCECADDTHTTPINKHMQKYNTITIQNSQQELVADFVPFSFFCGCLVQISQFRQICECVCVRVSALQCNQSIWAYCKIITCPLSLVEVLPRHTEQSGSKKYSRTGPLIIAWKPNSCSELNRNTTDTRKKRTTNIHFSCTMKLILNCCWAIPELSDTGSPTNE